MKVYQVQGEGDYRIVEAENYGRAVAIWRAFMIREFEYSLEDEPESVTLLCDSPVLRAEHKISAVAAYRKSIEPQPSFYVGDHDNLFERTAHGPLVVAWACNGSAERLCALLNEAEPKP